MTDLSFPPAFEQQMRARLGEHWPAFADAHRVPSPVSIRINPSKPIHFPNTTPVPWTATGFYLHERPSFTLDPSFHAGSYYVQEASSMFLEQAINQTVDTQAPLRVLDLCAAPGGKSTHLLALLGRDSLLVSNEVIRARAGILAENIQKWGYPNAVVTNSDPKDFERLPGFFDVMVVDAPCSGEGMFRKDPHAMHEWSPDNVALCSKRQRRILSDVWPALKEGGTLIYSTCTYNPSENEENLAWLKEEHGASFVTLRLDQHWGIVADEQHGIPGYRFYPDRVRGEGFFLAVVRKTSEENELRFKHKTSFSEPPKKIQEQLHAWLMHPHDATFILRGDLIQALPKQHAGAIDALAKNLYLITAGTSLATVKHDKLIPEHALALSTELARDHFAMFDVSLEDALTYLRKEALNISGKKGFALVMHQHLALGWINVLENRSNNLYPAEWRIRKQG